MSSETMRLSLHTPLHRTAQCIMGTHSDQIYQGRGCVGGGGRGVSADGQVGSPEYSPKDYASECLSQGE